MATCSRTLRAGLVASSSAVPSLLSRRAFCLPLRSLSTKPTSPTFPTPRSFSKSRVTLPNLPRSRILAALPRHASTLVAPAEKMAEVEATSEASLPPREAPASVSTWLFACSGMVFFIIIVGGLTRLTESGLSITEWEPITGILPPIGDEQWAVEWEKYRLSPEGIMSNSQMSMDEFKFIFYMEWAHRIAGRVLGLGFILPSVYYISRYRLPRVLQLQMFGLAVGIAAQGALGWYMVKSGLDQEIIDNNSVPRVSQYRLAAHLSAALALYIGMVQTAISLRSDAKYKEAAKKNLAGVVDKIDRLSQGPLRKYKTLVRVATFMVFFTAASGAFVAGLDAGLVYNEFPTMGGKLMPDTEELMDWRFAKAADRSDLWWRNLLENPVTVQWDHRVFATTTLAVVLSLPFIIRSPRIRSIIPTSARKLTYLTVGAVSLQVTLGITTLLYLVPVPLAATHQAGSVVLLTCLLALAGALRTPGKALRTRMLAQWLERKTAQSAVRPVKL